MVQGQVIKMVRPSSARPLVRRENEHRKLAESRTVASGPKSNPVRSSSTHPATRHQAKL